MEPSLGDAALREISNAVSTLEGAIASGPITPKVTPEEIRDYLASRFDFRRPLPLDEVVGDVERMLRNWQVHVTHPRYFGLFNPSVTLASIVGDLLAAMYNPQLATWRTSPAANEVERHTLAWISSKLGLPEDSAATFTSGGAEANLSAILVALTRAFPEYRECGLAGLAARPAIYLTTETHVTFHKIAQMTGLGLRSLRTVATGSDLRMDAADLARRIAEDRKNGFAPLLVVGNAGTTAAATIDPLPELADFCRRENLWFHVDAAWGGAAAISPRLRPHLSGIERADSITCDAHKWFSVPMGAGMFFCRRRDAVLEAFRTDNAIMPAQTDGVLDPYSTSVQWSRRFIGLKLFLALAHYGESGYIEMIERQARLGDLLRDLLGRSGWEIVNSSPLPLVCFRRAGVDPAQFVATLQQKGIAWMSAVKLSNGIHAARACITSIRTTEADIEHVVSAMGRLV